MARSYSRTRRAFALRPVRSVKEIIDGIFLGVAAGVTTTTVVATSVNSYVGTIGTCPIGATIKAMYVSVTYASTVSTPDSAFDWYIAKNPAGQLAMPQPGSTGGNPNRKWIFFESKGLAPNADDANPDDKSGWIKVPKKMQRMGEDDEFIITARNVVAGYNLCVKCIYKWFT